MYDITNMNSFENLQDWFGVVTKHFASSKVKPYLGLVGNKCKQCRAPFAVVASAMGLKVPREPSKEDVSTNDCVVHLNHTSHLN